MKIGGYSLRQHIRLLAPAFAFLAGVWALRWIIGDLGVPRWVLQVVSVTLATSLATLLAVLLIHMRRFGGYANVVVASLLLNVWGELLIVFAILFAVTTGIENIYVAPEYSISGYDPNQVRHMRGHLTFGIGVGTLTSAAMGCFLLFLLRKLAPMRVKPKRPAGFDWEQ
ncbi:MAG: hypothetical protein HXY20_03620 [Acidobacteria bacterium]|nr:hypothetical protein [Acidobacteriota bacterium]